MRKDLSEVAAPQGSVASRETRSGRWGRSALRRRLPAGRGPRVDYLDPFAPEHSSNAVLSLLSRSWIRKRIRSNTPVTLRLRGRTSLIDRARSIAVWLPRGSRPWCAGHSYLRALLAASPDPLIVLDRSGRCAFGDTAAGEMSEFEPMSLGGWPRRL